MANISKPKLYLGIVITIFAYLFLSIASAFVKSLNGHIPTMQIIFFQNLLSFLCISPFFLTKGKQLIKTHRINIHLVRDISSVLSYILYFFAIKYLNLIDATVLNYTSPFYIPFIWRIWMKEKVDHNVWWTIIIGFIGIALILKPGQNIINVYSIIGILAGIMSAISLVSLRILNTKCELLFCSLFYMFLVGTLISLPFVILYWQTPDLIQWFKIIAVGISIGISQILLTIAYRHGTASFLSPLSYSMVIFTIFISWACFYKAPNWLTILGIFLIIFGGTLSFILKRKPKKIWKLFVHSNKKKCKKL